MWLIMRGALSEQVDCLHRATYLPSMTNIATVIFQDKDSSSEDEIEAHQQKVGEQLAGIGDIPGTHPFTLERAHNAWRLNHFLHKLIEPAHRRQFIDSPDTLFAEFGLTEQEISLLNQRDWIGLIHYGVIFFSLEKMAAVLGMTNIDIYAQMRGETVEEFQQSRNSAITYSVAGKDKS
jgi:gallate dioxygenase